MLKKTLTLAIWLLLAISLAAQEKTYSVPESQLTQDQLKKLKGTDIKENVHAWAGVGKEVGEAVNSSLQAITVQTNSFAQTGVGKITVALVVWKVLGDQLVHMLGGLVELVIFIPIWLWSYRRTCMTLKFKMPDKTVKIVEYVGNRNDMTPRIAHSLMALGFVIVWLVTIFSY